MVSRPCRNIRPSSRDDRGVSCVSSSCRASVGFLTRYDEELMEPLVQCQVSQVSMPCRKIRPSSRDDWGVSCVSSICPTRGGFLPRHDEDLREPLVRRQGSHVSLHVARRSASLFSSHGRGLGPQDALKKDSRCLSRVAAGNPRFPRLLSGT